MKRIIDIHSHILPGVDDGCKDKAEALAMLDMYKAQNVEAVICTPHYGPCAITEADVNAAFNWLQSTSTDVKLYLGNEILFTRLTLAQLRINHAKALAGTRYVLIEFEDWMFQTPANEIFAGAKRIAESEYIPILAHPERYYGLQNDLGMYKRLTRAGVKLQVNAYDICENPNRTTRMITQWLLKKRLVSYIGSDAHGAKRRVPALQAGVRWIYDHCPTEYADAVVHDNAAKIIKGEG